MAQHQDAPAWQPPGPDPALKRLEGGSMTADSSQLAITTAGLRKSFGDKVVLDGIDLNVAAGTILALLGPNAHRRRPGAGSAKSPSCARRAGERRGAPALRRCSLVRHHQPDPSELRCRDMQDGQRRQCNHTPIL
jgi:hypothetical protein